MTYEQATTLYLDNCRASGKTPDTISSYSRTLVMLGGFLSAQGITLLSDVTTPVLAAWKAERAPQVSATTMRLYLTHIRVFFDFCTDMDFLVKSPFKKILDMEKSAIRAQQSEEYAHVLTEKDFRSILSNTNPKDAHKASYARNKAMLLILLTTGIRNESLRSLLVSDVNFSQKRICIRAAKGNKHGFAPLTVIAADAIKAYLAETGNVHGDSPLFGIRNDDGTYTPYSRTQTSNIVEAAVRSLTGNKGFYSHAMRHTFASLLANNGLADGEVSLLLYHSDGSGAKVTAKYIKRDYAKLYAKVNVVFNKIAFA